MKKWLVVHTYTQDIQYRYYDDIMPQIKDELPEDFEELSSDEKVDVIEAIADELHIEEDGWSDNEYNAEIVLGIYNAATKAEAIELASKGSYLFEVHLDAYELAI